MIQTLLPRNLAHGSYPVATPTRRLIINKAAEAMSIKMAPSPSAVAGNPMSPVLNPAAIAGTLKAR